jgi:hypothetical protein
VPKVAVKDDSEGAGIGDFGLLIDAPGRGRTMLCCDIFVMFEME